MTGEESSQLSSIISAYKKLVADELEDIDEEKENEEIKTVIDEHAFNYDYDCIGVMPSYSEEKTKGLLAGLFSRHM